MENRLEQREVIFRHVVLEGTAYEVGRAQGEMCKGDPGLVSFLTKPPEDAPPLPQQTEEAMKLFDRYCPGVNDEIRGFADALGVSPEEIVYYAFSYQVGGQCSQFVVSPDRMQDGRFYVGRNYEWGFNDDFRLVTTRVQGNAAHLGFSVPLFGRLDGFNEHGLVVTMSAGAPNVPVTEGGVRFWVAIRTLLDRCHNVAEALEVLGEIPISFNVNILLADRSGQAALVEIACSQRAVWRIGPDTAERVLLATNHYNHPDMLPFDQGRMWQSVARYQALQRVLCAPEPVAKEDLRRVLSSPLPDGVCCHYYSNTLGTLWSAIYDVQAGEAEIAIGSPHCNPWRRFGLKDPVGVTEYPAVFPLERPADPKAFFRRLAPGANE